MYMYIYIYIFSVLISITAELLSLVFESKRFLSVLILLAIYLRSLKSH